MTVAELIELLKTLPQDLPVVAYAVDEDFANLQAGGVEIIEEERTKRRCVSIIGWPSS